jgi:hypothetical protein
MRVLILGNDPSMLIAGLAAMFRRGHELVMVLPIGGGFADGVVGLGIPGTEVSSLVPGIERFGPSHDVSVLAQGSRDGWITKVGRPDKVPEHFGTAIYKTYLMEEVASGLASYLGPGIVPWNVQKESLKDMVGSHQPNLVINTLNRGYVCLKPYDHGFARRDVFVARNFTTVPAGTVILNGLSTPAWYSSMNIGQIAVTKWMVKPPFSAVREMTIPISTNCDCYPEFTHIGPEATYNPITTLLDVFSETTAAIMKMEENHGRAD